MKKTVLIIGGTGPTGPHVVQGFLDKGYDVTILHRGVHEPEGLPDVPHIHADPHFHETMEVATKGKSFDIVVAMYGRLSVLAEVFSKNCSQFIAVGGRPIYPGYMEPKSVYPHGMVINAQEFSVALNPAAIRAPSVHAFTRKMMEAEEAVMRAHSNGCFNATLFRFPYIYGARSVLPLEWSIIRRIRDGRTRIPMTNGGLNIFTRAAAENAAHSILLASEYPAAYGQIFNIGDEDQYSYSQWAQLVASVMGREVEVVSVPGNLTWIAGHGLPFQGTATPHAITDTTKIRTILGYRDSISSKVALRNMIEALLKKSPDETMPGWTDPFDYTLEDRLFADLDDMQNRYAKPEDWPAPLHVYAHPKEKGTGRDHRGR